MEGSVLEVERRRTAALPRFFNVFEALACTVFV